MIISPDNRILYIANGVSPDFAFPKVFYNQTHLQVFQNGVLKSRGTHYTVTPETNTPTGTVGGTIKFVVAPPADDIVLILRVVPLTQEADLKDLSIFPADIVEARLDLGVMMVQQHEEKFNRALLVPVTSTLIAPVLPDPVLAANQGKVLRIRADGTGFDAVAFSSTDFVNPLTTKGDLVSHNGATHGRVPVGNEDESLSVATAATFGLSYQLNASLGDVLVHQAGLVFI